METKQNHASADSESYPHQRLETLPDAIPGSKPEGPSIAFPLLSFSPSWWSFRYLCSQVEPETAAAAPLGALLRVLSIPTQGSRIATRAAGTTGDSQGTRPQAGQGDSECPGAIPALPRAERATHLTCPWPTVCAPLLRSGCAERGGGSQQLARASRGRGGCSHSPGAARPRLIRQRQLQAEARGATPRIHMVWWDSAAG